MAKSIELLQEICTAPGSDRPLRFAPDASSVADDGRRFRSLDGVPVLRAEPPPVERMPVDQVTNLLSPDRIEAMRGASGYTLFVGAGNSSFRAPRVVELEYQLFRDTDVVGDAHALPFRTGTFDHYVAMNVFEHLRDPVGAAREAMRVLRPGGEIVIHTAFLQPVHEAPAHYYNATEYGVREWFRDFEGVDVRVSPNFNPIYALSWIAHDLLRIARERMGPEATKRFAGLTLEELAGFWSAPNDFDAETLEHFWSIPQAAQAGLAAGFEMTARKPGG